MSQRTYSVTGMSCTHCIRSITAEVGALPGVDQVVVRLGRGLVDVVGADQPSIDDVRTAVASAGYELVGAVT